MADINYLYYGDQQVDQQALMNQMANEVNNYVQNQSWTRKRKERFMSAYLDIIQRGLKGASNNTGEWVIDFGGTPDWSTKDKEMYEEAAYFIQQQMGNLAVSIKEEEPKKELPTFTADTFLKGFKKYVNDQISAGFNLQIGGEDDQWNYLDPRDTKTGLRGRTERAKKLSQLLQGYLDTLNTQEYNFEGGPFKNTDELKSRISNAVKALTETPENFDDDKLTLQALGLKASDYFNNGSGDFYVDETGQYLINPDTQKPFTYGDLYNYNLNKEKEETKLKEGQKALIDSLQVFTNRDPVRLYSSNQLSKKYPNGIQSFINKYAKVSIDQLTQDENDELYSLFYNGATDNELEDIKDEEWEIIKQKVQLPAIKGSYNNTIERSKKQFKKIKDLPGLFYDTVENKIYQIGKPDVSTDISDLFKSPQDVLDEKQKLREDYEKRTQLSAQDIEYLASIIPDLVSIANVEPLTAGGSAIAGSVMRHHALSSRPGGMNTSDKLWQALDYLGGVLAAVPAVGDAYLIGRVLNTVKKVATPLIGAAGIYGIGSSTVDLLTKLANGEDLSLQDQLNIIQSLPMILSSVRARHAQGVNEAVRAANEGVAATKKGKVKVTLNLPDQNPKEVTISGLSETKAKEIQKKFKEFGDDNQKKIEYLKQDAEVKQAAGNDFNWEVASIETPKRSWNTLKRPSEVELYDDYVATQNRANYEAELARLKQSNWFDRRTARRLEWADKVYNFTGGAKKQTPTGTFRKVWDFLVNPGKERVEKIRTASQEINNQNQAPQVTPTTQIAREISYAPDGISKTQQKFLNRSLGFTSSKRSKKAPVVGVEPVGRLINGQEFTTTYSPTDKAIIAKIEGNEVFRSKSASIVEAQKEFGQWINEQNNKIKQSGIVIARNSEEWSKFIDSIKKLKQDGFLMKQGGKITDNQIKNFLNKYKV